MKASNLTLVFALLFFSPVSYLNAQQDFLILAKIDETVDYREQKEQNAKLYSNLQVPEYQQKFEVSSNQIGFESGLVLLPEETTEWVNLDLTDDGSVLIALPFEFVFYGEPHSEIWVNANGNISFNQSVGSFKSEQFPIVVPMIAPFWTDLVSTDDDLSGVFVGSDEGSIRVLWKNMRINDSNLDDVVSFELVLYATENTSAQNESGSDFQNAQTVTHQGNGNKHIRINYLEMPLDLTHGGDGHMRLRQGYVAGVNSGNGTCGHHAFDVQIDTAVAYAKM